MSALYWSTTSVISVFLLLSSYSYLFIKPTIEGIKSLGFPDFFILQLAILKLVAAVILLVPFASLQIKEWAYAGVAFFLITAFVAHLKHKDSIAIMILLIILFGVLIVSNIEMNRI